MHTYFLFLPSVAKHREFFAFSLSCKIIKKEQERQTQNFSILELQVTLKIWPKSLIISMRNKMRGPRCEKANSSINFLKHGLSIYLTYVNHNWTIPPLTYQTNTQKNKNHEKKRQIAKPLLLFPPLQLEEPCKGERVNQDERFWDRNCSPSSLHPEPVPHPKTQLRHIATHYFPVSLQEGKHQTFGGELSWE